ncbi:MAG TPA: hypothetical protein VH796_01655 [Nitrososphaeraceae archaeon]
MIHGPVTVNRATLRPGQQLNYKLQHYSTIVLKVVGKKIIIQRDSISRSTTGAIKQAMCFIFKGGIEKA